MRAKTVALRDQILAALTTMDPYRRLGPLESPPY